MPASALFILDLKGKVACYKQPSITSYFMFKALSPLPLLQSLISRDYRGDVNMSVIDKFLPMVLDMEDEGNTSPILVYERSTFVYIKHNNLYRILYTKCVCVGGGPLL